MNNGKIGVMDSGFGGVSTLAQAMRLLPNESFLYYGDNGNAPYGDRSEAEIQELTLAAARQLADKGAKAILIACNTATAAALGAVQAALPIPVSGIRPAIVQAFEARSGGIVLMLATEATTKLTAYRALHQSLPDPACVKDVPCPVDVVKNVEAGVQDMSVYMEILGRVLSQYEGAVVDGIVLGCTHYPFMEEAVRAYAQQHFQGARQIFEGGRTAVEELEENLMKFDLYSAGGTQSVEFFTSGDAVKLSPIFSMLLEIARRRPASEPVGRA